MSIIIVLVVLVVVVVVVVVVVIFKISHHFTQYVREPWSSLFSKAHQVTASWEVHLKLN
jgi:hypothetical protein